MVTIEQVRSSVAEVVGVDPAKLTREVDLYSLPDFDSVAVLSLIVALDDLGIEVPQSKAAEIRTFGDVLQLANLK